jgi:hypothetical protein
VVIYPESGIKSVDNQSEVCSEVCQHKRPDFPISLVSDREEWVAAKSVEIRMGLRIRDPTR